MIAGGKQSPKATMDQYTSKCQPGPVLAYRSFDSFHSNMPHASKLVFSKCGQRCISQPSLPPSALMYCCHSRFQNAMKRHYSSVAGTATKVGTT